MNKLQHISTAKLLLEEYGYDSLSYFSLNAKKKFFFSSTATSFLSYIIVGKVALVSGDPVGPDSDIPTLLQEFHYFIKGAGLTCCFIATSEKLALLLSQMNHKHVHIGEEAILDLSVFQKEELKKKVRRAERHIRDLGIRCEVYNASALPRQYLTQIKEISQEWLEKKGKKERGFSMTLGRIPAKYDDCEFVVAIEGKKLLGYLTFVPAYASKTLSLDAARKRKTAPNGLIEFLLLQSFDYYKAREIAKISLNFAAFHTIQNSMQKPSRSLKQLLFKPLKYVYKTNNLYQYNLKFNPNWQSRYLSFEKVRYIPLYIIAIGLAELFM